MSLGLRCIGIMTLLAGRAHAAQTLTYADLVHRLTDMEHLATLPAPGERCAQASSYDRASRYDPATGRYLNWSANGDGSGLVRTEDGKAVLAELAGPGVIWRFWQALAGPGHIAIYLDGQSEPAVDLPAEGYFNGKNAPFDREALVYTAAKGRNCYVPIPFQTSCKIVATGDWGRYYQFTYSLFPKGTQVPTFTRQLSPADAAALDDVNEQLLHCGQRRPGPYPDEKSLLSSGRVEAGKTLSFAELEGPRAITGLRVRLPELDTERAREVLRSLVLRITWDGEADPAVLVPLGDFFGTAPGISLYRSWPTGMTEDGFYSDWYMPFAERATVEIVHEGRTPQQVAVEIKHAALSRPIDALARFRAGWHDGLEPPAGRSIDWTFLKTTGRGRFCGLALYVWNPLGGWWGEGDEKFFIDGETFPSTFGTGTEDYFGYAWCSEEFFARPFHNQPRSVPMNACAHPGRETSGGWIANNRWQIADNIPFQKSFEGAVEKYFPDDRPTRYTCTAYWYAQHPHPTRPALPAVAHRLFDRSDKETLLFDLMASLEQYDGQSSLAPMRDTFEAIVDDPAVGRFRSELILRLAAAEARGGDVERGRERLAPVLDELTEPFMVRELAPAIHEVVGRPAWDDGSIQPCLVTNGDGSWKRVRKDGRWCIASDQAAGRPFIYFAFPEEAGVRETDRTYQLVIDFYHDGVPGEVLHVDYDSHYGDDIPGMYRISPPVTAGAEKGWQTATIELSRARFSARQNAKADMRIIGRRGNDIFLGDVRLMRPQEPNGRP